MVFTGAIVLPLGIKQDSCSWLLMVVIVVFELKTFLGLFLALFLKTDREFFKKIMELPDFNSFLSRANVIGLLATKCVDICYVLNLTNIEE